MNAQPTSEQPTERDLEEMREYLQANNGIQNLEIYSPDATTAIVEAFHRDGFVAVADVLNAEQIDMLADGCHEVIDEILALDADLSGNRGSHRYSFGGSSLTRSQLHRPAWQMLLQIPRVTELVSHIFASEDYILRAASGDF